MLSALAIRHLHFEDLGRFAPALRAAGYQVTYHDVGPGSLSTLDSLGPDLLIVLGGPISVYDEARYPWLLDEIRLIASRLAAGLPTLGICLGAQIMARALRARVYPAEQKEIGFAPVTLTAAGRASAVASFEGIRVLHWHGDNFDLPDGAVRLASTRACPNQAFSHGRNAIAFQFHPEAGDSAFERWLIGHALELAIEGVDLDRLRADHSALSPDLASRAADFLVGWLGQLDVPGRASAAPFWSSIAEENGFA